MHLKTLNPSCDTRILRVTHGRDARATSASTLRPAGSKLFQSCARVTYNRRVFDPERFSTRLTVNNSCPSIDNSQRRPSTALLRRRHRF